MEIGDTLDVRTRAGWRAWLRRNHARKKEIWLVLHTKASGRPSIAYNDAVDEALCFGWIDSIVKKVGAQSRAQRFTPRRKGSPVSEMNKARARRLVRERRMTSAGRAALGSALRRERLVVAPDVQRALRAEPGAWTRFARLPAAYKRIRLGFIARPARDILDAPPLLRPDDGAGKAVRDGAKLMRARFGACVPNRIASATKPARSVTRLV